MCRYSACRESRRGPPVHRVRKRPMSRFVRLSRDVACVMLAGMFAASVAVPVQAFGASTKVATAVHATATSAPSQPIATGRVLFKAKPQMSASGLSALGVEVRESYGTAGVQSAAVPRGMSPEAYAAQLQQSGAVEY